MIQRGRGRGSVQGYGEGVVTEWGWWLDLEGDGQCEVHAVGKKMVGTGFEVTERVCSDR